MRLGVAKEYMFGKALRRPPRPLAAIDPRPGWARPIESGLRTTWLGHSTVLLEQGGARVLTDPVWSERISPFGVVAPRRFQPVPIPVTDVPELDAIVISHDHFDHLDHHTIEALASRTTPFIVPLGVGMYLEAWGIPPERVIELDWWESIEIRGLTITATPSQHFSGRVGKRNKTLWASFVIVSANHRVFFSGDTALTPEFEQVRERFAPFDLVMLEVGAYHPAWGEIHLGPDNALTAHRMLGGAALLPVHWGTFDLGLHPWDQPIETLSALAPSRGIDLLTPILGQPVEPSRVDGITPWWRSVVAEERAADKTQVPTETSSDLSAVSWPVD